LSQNNQFRQTPLNFWTMFDHQAELDRTYISALERCVYAASIDVVGRIAEVLEVKPSGLLTEHEQ